MVGDDSMGSQLGLTGAGIFRHELRTRHVLVVKQFFRLVLLLAVFLRLDFFIVLSKN